MRKPKMQNFQFLSFTEFYVIISADPGVVSIPGHFGTVSIKTLDNQNPRKNRSRLSVILTLMPGLTRPPSGMNKYISERSPDTEKRSMSKIYIQFDWHDFRVPICNPWLSQLNIKESNFMR